MKNSVKQAQSIVGTSSGRPKDDFYPTPAYVTEALLQKEEFFDPILEPACGDGAISKVLLQNRYVVRSYDLHNHGYGIFPVDYLSYNAYPPSYTMITNPPFSLFSEFVKKSILLGFNKFALFGKLSILEGKVRSKLLEETHLTRVHVFRSRVQLTRNGETATNSGMIAFAWFVWVRGNIGSPIIDWI